MNLFNTQRAGFVLGLLSGLVQMGCSDDDGPLPVPPITTAGDDASAPLDAGASGPASSSSDASSKTSDAATSTPTSTSAEEAGPDAAAKDASDAADVGWLEGLTRDPETTIFAELIVRAEMLDDLNKEGAVTVLAPTNSGFDRLPDGWLESLTRKQVETLVRHHLLSGPQSSADLAAAGTVFSILGIAHQFASSGGRVYVNGLTRITDPDDSFGLDTVHKLDSVLTVDVFPGTLEDAVHAYPRLSDFESRLTEHDRQLLRQDDKTLFAPINGGFGAFPVDTAIEAGDASIGLSALSYHVLSNNTPASMFSTVGVTQTALGPFISVSNVDGLVVSDGRRLARVVTADLAIQSGEVGSVLHVVDTALVAPPTVDQVLAQPLAGETFATLRARMAEVTAPNGSGTLLDHLARSEAVTVFAPPDAAFDRVPGSFGSSLGNVLGFHVMEGVVDSARLRDLGDDDLPSTLTNSSVKTFALVTVADASETTFLLDGLVQVTTRDVPAANGVIHVVDGVLVPQDVTFPGTTVQALASFPALSKVNGAAAETGLLSGVTSTLFAPFDLAWGDAGSATSFVETHAITPGAYVKSALGSSVFTLLGGASIDVDSTSMTIGEVKIIRPDLLTQSGVVHIVDGLLPADGVPELDASP